MILQVILILTSCDNKIDPAMHLYYSPKFHLIHIYDKYSYINEIQVDVLFEGDSSTTISIGPLIFKNHVINLDSIKVNPFNKCFGEFMAKVKEYDVFVVDLHAHTGIIKKNDIKIKQLFFIIL